MKIRGSQLLWVVLAAAAVIWAGSRLLGGEARKIRRQLAELEQLIEKEEGESNLIGANKVRRIGELLAPQFEIDIVPYSQVVRDRQQLLRVAMGYRSRSATIEVDFRQHEIDVDAAARSASHRAVAVLSGRDRGRESYRIAFQWTEIEGEWLVRRIDVLEVLEGVPAFF